MTGAGCIERVGDERSETVGAMQTELFCQPFKRPTPLAVAAVVSELMRASDLNLFDAFLVGSVVYAPETSRDVDLVLTPKSGACPSIQEVEAALVTTVKIGLDHGGVCVDPVFRRRLQKDLVAERTKLVGIKLEDPGLTYWKEVNPKYSTKEIGNYLLEGNFEGSEYFFFNKLPGTGKTRQMPWIAVSDLQPWLKSDTSKWPTLHR